MMRILFAILLFCCFLFVLTNSFATRILAQNTENADVNENSELTFEIDFPLPIPWNDSGLIDVNFILKNVSQKPVRICTHWSRGGHRWIGNYYEDFLVDDRWIKSPPRNFTQSFITLAPGESFKITKKIPFPRNVQENRLIFSSSFYISKKFASHYNTWSGAINAKPVTVDIE